MKIAIAQFAPVVGDVAANCAKMSDFATRARDRGCDVVVFPEMSDTGYEMPVIRKTAGAAFASLQQTAAHTGLHVVAGLSERDGDKIYNASAVFAPDGALLGKYRKTHLFPLPPVREHDTIAAGDRVALLPLGGFTLGLMICYDLRFPELARTLTLRGADVLVVVSAWPFPRLLHWTTLLAARAIENQTYVVAANRIGTDAQSTYCGSSRVVDPYGIVTAAAAEDREELLVADLDPTIVHWARDRMPLLKQRREDVYRG